MDPKSGDNTAVHEEFTSSNDVDSLQMTKTELEDLQLPGNVHAGDIKLDQHGMPLIPQPTNDPLDPLNWPLWLKFTTLIQVSLIAFLGLLGAALIV